MLDLNHPVIIDFTHNVSPFEELWPATHRALLPIIGKPILLHVLERLRNSGYRHFRIARHLQQPFVKNRLGNGQEWGLTLRYSDLSGPDLVNEALMCFGETIMVFGDQLLASETTFEHTENAEAARTGKPSGRAGMYKLVGGEIDYRPLSLTIDPALDVLSVRDYQKISFRYCSKLTQVDTAPGAPLHRAAMSDWKTEIAPDVLVGDSCFVGKHCRISRGVVLQENCVLGNGVYVDKRVRLRNCVVLPNTYIGKSLELNDCVVSSKGAVHVSGEFSAAKAKSTLSSTRSSRESTTGLPRDIKIFTQA